MSGDKYLLSIVIPTRNRQMYALKAVEQVLSITSDKMQLIIQDNSDNDKLKYLLSEYSNDKRLKYNYANHVLSFVDNFSQAVALADGEYLCMIGDDDGIMPEILDLTIWLRENNIDAATSTVNAVYIWPSKETIINNAENGYMCLSYVSEDVSFCDTKRAVMELMSCGGQKYSSMNMAKVYHGVVRKDCMDRVRNITGHYFGGLSPDIYASVALSIVANKVVKIRYPVTISGICEASGSADSATGKHTGKLKDAPHFRGHASYNWSNEVPAFYCVETIWADTALQALRELNANEYVSRFSIAALDMYCLKNHRSFKNTIIGHCKNNRVSNLSLLTKFIHLPILDFVKRCLRRLLRKEEDVIKVYGIQDIGVAQKTLAELLEKKNISCEGLLINLDKLLR